MEAASRADCFSGGNGVGGITAATYQQWWCQQQKRSALKEGAEAASRADCCSSGNGGGGGAATRQQWRCQQQKRSALEEGAEAASRADCYSGGNGGGCCLNRDSGRTATMAAQQQKSNNGGKCDISGCIFEYTGGDVVYSNIHGEGPRCIFEYTHQCTVSVHIADYIRFNMKSEACKIEFTQIRHV